MPQIIMLPKARRAAKRPEPTYPLRTVKKFIVDFAWAVLKLSEVRKVTKGELRTILNERLANL